MSGEPTGVAPPTTADGTRRWRAKGGDTRIGYRVFASPVEESRGRRASDVVLLVAGSIMLALLAWIADPPAAFEQALIDLLASVPGFLSGVWQLGYDLLASWALVVLAAALVRRRLTLARDLALAAVTALAVSVALTRLVQDSWPDVWDALLAAEPPPWFPAVRVAVAAAVVSTASPYLSRPTRRVGRVVVTLGVVSVMMLGAATPVGAVAGVVVGVLGAATVHLVFGSGGGRPGLREVAAALAELGVPTSNLGAAARQPAGLFLVQAEDEAGVLLVKVYGRDAYDAQLLAKLWRTVWYRGAGSPPTLSRLQQAEHEAFLTLLARQAGVPTQAVVTAGATADDDALLVLRGGGRALVDVAADAVNDDLLRRLWRVLRVLHEGDIAHGQLDPNHVVVDEGRPTLIDFSGATVAPSDEQRRTDEAQLVMTSVVVAGEERGLRVACEALGAAGLAAILPYLQVPALTPMLRSLVRAADVDLDEVRAHAAVLAGVKPPELERLRRVTLGSALQSVLLVVAFYFLVSGISGLDLEDVSDELADATWWWMVFGALLVQTPRLCQAVATLGACPLPLPLGPVYALQLAISYVNLAIPSSAARIALNVRFFQRQGVPPGSALAIGAIDGFSGFIVQVLLLVSILLFSTVSLDLALEPDTTGGPGRLLAAIIVVAVAALATVVLVPAWRRAVLGKVAEGGRQAWSAVRGLRSPRRLAMLFGGNLASEVLFALSLGAFVQAFGYSVPLGELLLINVSVALLAGLMPIPGGIGVAEGGLTVGLVAAGLPESAAFAIAIMYRLASFYLPPIWGWYAFRWLQRNKHL